MDKSLKPVAFTKLVFQDFGRLWPELLILDVAFQLLRAWLIVPLIALALSLVLFKAGRVAVSNQEILDFLLTPMGGMYLAVLSTTAAILILLEQAGMLTVIGVKLNCETTSSPAGQRDWQSILASFWRISQLGIAKLTLLICAAIPFLMIAGLTYVSLLTEYDIYYYLKMRPPVFWQAVGIGLILLLMSAAVGMFLLVRWLLALPISLFETKAASAALTASHQRVRGARWPIATLLIGWGLGTFGLGLLLTGSFRLVVERVLVQFGRDSIPVLIIMLLMQSALIATISFVSSATLSLLIYRIYCLRRPSSDDANGELSSSPISQSIQSDTPSNALWVRLAASVAVALSVLGPLTLWGVFAERAASRQTVLVTAHRGFAAQAPENTLSAIQRAIDIHADYTEIDVHQTRDGVVVLLHDRDFRRVARDSRRLDQLSFQEAREIDVGSWFSAQFAGEHVPTLEEAIQLCRGKIRVNIELKVFGRSEALAEAVAKIVKEHAFETNCIVTSLSEEALLHVRRHNTEIPVGIIVGKSIGDLNRMKVEALSVRADHLSDEMIRSAHQQQRQVMVWGIQGEQQINEQLRRGVDNLIASDPQLAIKLRDRWRDACDHERVVIALQLLLGLKPSSTPG